MSQFVVDNADEDEEYGSKIVFNDNPQVYPKQGRKVQHNIIDETDKTRETHMNLNTKDKVHTPELNDK